MCVLGTWRDGYQSLPACCVFRKKFFRAESCAEEILFLCMEFILLFANKKRAILAYHPECLHNGIILIVYILQICCYKNNKIYSFKFAYFLFFLYLCSQIVHWNPDNTTWQLESSSWVVLCIAYKSIFEILIKQLIGVHDEAVHGCVLHIKVSLKSW